MRTDLDPRTRNTILFLGGFVGAAWETFHERVDRPYLLALFGGMMGLTQFINRDKKDENEKGEKGE